MKLRTEKCINPRKTGIKVNYEIVEMELFSGSAAKVYSIIPKGEDETLFDKFVGQHEKKFKGEIKEILTRLKHIGHTTGAREFFFKHEGDNVFTKKYGQCVWALYDDDKRKLRLYCIRFGSVAIILGGGGYKDKSVKKWQDDPNLEQAVTEIMAYAEHIFKQMKDGEIYWSKDKTALEGNLKNYEDE